MSNINKSAFPTIKVERHTYPDEQRFPWTDLYSVGGLTKREYFAAMAMQGLCLNTNAMYEKGQHDAAIAARAVSIADYLLAELEKKPTTP